MNMLRSAVSLLFCVAGAMGKCNIYKKYKHVRSVGAFTYRPSIGNMYPVELMCMLACNQMSTCQAFQLLRNATCELVLSTMPAFAVDERYSLYATEQLKCPSGPGLGGFVPPCYIFVLQKMVWAAGRDKCRSLGGELVSIESQKEQMYITTLMENDTSLRLKGNNGYWTSGSDEDKEGTWIWKATGGPLTYKFWGARQPDNWNIENYLHIGFNGLYQWNDAANWHLCFLICEFSGKLNGSV